MTKNNSLSCTPGPEAPGGNPGEGEQGGPGDGAQISGMDDAEIDVGGGSTAPEGESIEQTE